MRNSYLYHLLRAQLFAFSTAAGSRVAPVASPQHRHGHRGLEELRTNSRRLDFGGKDGFRASLKSLREELQQNTRFGLHVCICGMERWVMSGRLIEYLECAARWLVVIVKWMNWIDDAWKQFITCMMHELINYK